MPKASKKKYCQSSVDSAVDAVACGSTIRAASAQYGVPSSTLFGKLKYKAPVKASMGPSSILTATEEQHLVDWIFHVSERGFPITKEQLLNAVQKLVVELERETPFTNNRPGRHWYEAFCRRHKELSQRIAQNLTYSRASATEEKLRGWFQEVSQYLKSKGLLNIDPSRVYNCDESGFFLCPKADHVIVRKGAKRVYNVVNADEKENLTTLFMVNAAGMLVPPMVMFWYQRVPKSVTDNVPSGWSIGTSDRGWMTAETFFEYVTNVFYPWLQQNNVEFPVVLYVDGHSSHCTLPLSNFCREKNIELIALYPNATHILQPLDVAVFHPLKSAWKKTVNQWRFENCGNRLKKEQFAPLLKVALDSLDLTATIRNGFRSCGLAPFSADAVDFNVLRKGMSSSDDTCHNDPSTLQAETKFVEHLRLMEQQLPANVISAFEESHRSGVWSGESTNEGLYQYWLKIKRLAANNGQNDIQLEALEDGTRANDILHFAADLGIGFRSETESTFQQGDSIILTFNGDDIIDAESSEPVGVEVIDESCITILTEGCVNSIAEDSSEKIEGIVEECDENIAKIVEECNENIAEIVEEAIGTGVQSVVQTTGVKQNSLNTEESAAKAVGETRRSPLNVLNSVNVQIADNTPKSAAKRAEEIPSVFKNSLFWPEDRKKVTKKKKTTEKLPSVATSDQWLLLASQKEEEKLKMLQEKEERRIKREKMQEQKKVTQLEKQKLQEDKKKQQEEKKKEQEEIKKQQQEEKKKHQEEKKKQQEEKMKQQKEKKKQQEEKKKQQQEKKKQQEEKRKQQEEKKKQQKENEKQQEENEKQQEENEKQQEENEKLEKEIEGKTNKVVVIVM